jgi:hypothetical protein
VETELDDTAAYSHWIYDNVSAAQTNALRGIRARLLDQESTPFIAAQLNNERINAVLKKRMPGKLLPFTLPISIECAWPNGIPDDILSPQSQAMMSRQRPYQSAEAEESFWSASLCGALEQCLDCSPPRFTSPLFTVEQEEKFRLIFDLRRLNSTATSGKFQGLETLLDVPLIARTSMYMSKLDLKSAFWQVPIDLQLREYFGCVGPDGNYYTWTCLPFGFTHSPRLFDALGRSFVEAWRSAGLTVMIYVDDLIIFSTSIEQHISSIEMVTSDLIEAGIRISSLKAFLRPYVVMDFLGMTIDLRNKSFRVTPKKAARIREQSTGILNDKFASRRDLLSLLGRLAFVSIACPYVLAFRIALNKQAYSGVDPEDMNEPIPLDDRATEQELQYWASDDSSAMLLGKDWPWNVFATSRLRLKHGLTAPLPCVHVWGDASDFGLGMEGNNLELPPSELMPSHITDIPIEQASSTLRELWVIYRLIQLARIPNGTVLRVYSDNTGAVATANTSSISASLAPLMKLIIAELLTRDITLQACWLPREDLSDVDARSRDFTGAQHCVLAATDMDKVVQFLGGCPDLEMFACTASRVFGRPTMHCSQHIENDSIGDAFAIDLSQVRSIWAFPPFALARPFIAFLQQHESSLPDIVMCLPHWSIVQAAIACIRGSSMTGIVTQALAPPRYDRSFPVPHDLIMVTIRGTSAKTRLRVAPYVAPNDLWRGNVIVLADELHDAHCLQDYTDTDVLARVAENTMANRHVSIFRTRNSCTALIIRIKNGVIDTDRFFHEIRLALCLTRSTIALLLNPIHPSFMAVVRPNLHLLGKTLHRLFIAKTG